MKHHEVQAARIKELEKKLFDAETENEALKVKVTYALERAKPVLESASTTLDEAQAEMSRLNANVADLTNHARRLEEANERLKAQAEAVHNYQLQTIATPIMAMLVGNLWDPRSEIRVANVELEAAADIALRAADSLLTAISNHATSEEG